MTPPTAVLGPPVQIAYAVPDAAAAAAQWARRFGAGPFVVRRHIPVRDASMAGRPISFDHTSAYGQWGDVMVELVEFHLTSTGAMPGFGPSETAVLHHLAHLVDDLDEAIGELVLADCEIALDATTAGGTRFVFVDTRPMLGHLVELYQRSDRLESFYASIAGAAAGWDGTDPVREG